MKDTASHPSCVNPTIRNRCSGRGPESGLDPLIVRDDLKDLAFVHEGRTFRHFTTGMGTTCLLDLYIYRRALAQDRAMEPSSEDSPCSTARSVAAVIRP